MSTNLKRPAVSNITVFEFGLISASPKASQDHRVTRISALAFEYLKKCCLCDDTDSQFLKLKIAFGMEVLQLQNYAGVLLCPDGTQIEVLPKIAKHDNEQNSAESARLSLLMMLRTLKQFRYIQSDIASIKKQKMPLLEIFIAQFLDSVNNLIKKGIKSDYVRKQSNSSFLKGKLLHSQQLKHNFINRHKFFIEYDAYEMDRSENRVIHSALKAVSSYTSVNRNKKLVQELLFAFCDIPLSENVANDFAGIKIHRGMLHYESPVNWARLILEGFSPQAMLGSHNAFSLLFPMEAIFESFVAHYLKKQIPPPTKLSAQVQSKTLVSYGDKNFFRLKPDLYLSNVLTNDVVLDTKWKLIDQTKQSGKDKFGLSQQDFYQMLGYGHKYLKGEGQMVLIYPKTCDFDKPLAHSFDYDEHRKLKLWVLPFDIGYNSAERIDLSIIGI